MKTIDHLLLGQYLCKQYETPALRRHRRIFLFGCVEPDYNVFSYLRGMQHYEKFRGHNAENSFAFLSACMARFNQHGISSIWDFFRLGTMLHYVADAFTAPHNRFWKGSLLEHIVYENALHPVFKAMLKAPPAFEIPEAKDILLHQHYCVGPHSMETDCYYILTVCASLLQKYLPCAESTKETGGILHEDFDYNRLVPASH